MKYLLKTTLLTLFLLLSIGISLQAQIAVLQYRSVPQENIAEFLHRETTYWAEVAQKAIDDGKLMGWQLWQRVGGVNLDDQSYNFVFANIFADKSGLDQMGSIWNPSDALPDVRISDIETNSLSKVVHMIIVNAQGDVGEGGNFARVNYAKVSDMENYLTHENDVWKPFIGGLMKEGKTSCVGWGVATVVSPGGSSMPFNAYTIDYYDKMSEAVQPTWGEGVEFPDFTEYAKTMERVNVQVYALVKKVSKDQ